MIVKTSLIVVSIDWQTGEFFTLAGKDEPWRPFVTDMKLNIQPIDSVRSRFGDFVDLSVNWVNPTLRSARVDEDNNLMITYSCNIPLDSELYCEYKWVEAATIEQDAQGYDDLIMAVRSIS